MYQANTEKVRFDVGDDSFVTNDFGIGVTDPDQKLEGAGAIHMSGEVATPSQPSGGDGGIMYVKTDGKLYWRSNEISETDLTEGGGGGGLVEGGTVVDPGQAYQYVNKFDVTGTTYHEPSITLETGSDRGSFMSFLDDDGARFATIGSSDVTTGGTAGLHHLAFAADSGKKIIFWTNAWTNATATMVLAPHSTSNTAGYVGIGTDSPNVESGLYIQSIPSGSSGSPDRKVAIRLSNPNNNPSNDPPSAESVIEFGSSLHGGSGASVAIGGGGSGAFKFYHPYANNSGPDYSDPSLTIDDDGDATFHDSHATSDQRVKNNIQTISSALSKVAQMRGATFNRIDKNNNDLRSGVIAQEIELIAPEVVKTATEVRIINGGEDDELTIPDMKSVNYEGIIGYLIEAIKELNIKNTALESRVAALEA